MAPSLLERGVDPMELGIVQQAAEGIKPVEKPKSTETPKEAPLFASMTPPAGGDRDKKFWDSLEIPAYESGDLQPPLPPPPQSEPRNYGDSLQLTPRDVMNNAKRLDDLLGRGPVSPSAPEPAPIAEASVVAATPPESENEKYLKMAQEKARSDQTVVSGERAVLNNYLRNIDYWMTKGREGYDSQKDLEYWQQQADEARGRVQAAEKVLEETQTMIDFFSGKAPAAATSEPVSPPAPQAEPVLVSPNTGRESFRLEPGNYQNQRFETKVVGPETQAAPEQQEAETKVGRQELKVQLANGTAMTFGPDVAPARIAEIMRALGTETAPRQPALDDLEELVQPQRTETASAQPSPVETRPTVEAPRPEMPKINLLDMDRATPRRTLAQKFMDKIGVTGLWAKFTGKEADTLRLRYQGEAEKRMGSVEKKRREYFAAAQKEYDQLSRWAQPIFAKFPNAQADLLVSLGEVKNFGETLDKVKNLNQRWKEKRATIAGLRKGLRQNEKDQKKYQAESDSYFAQAQMILDRARTIAPEVPEAGQLARDLAQLLGETAQATAGGGERTAAHTGA